MDKLHKICDELGLIVKEKNLVSANGRIKDNKIAIKSDLTYIEKRCVLAEELGHYYTAVGNILNQDIAENRKQELKGRAWAYNYAIGLDGIIKAYKNNCRTMYETAEFLNVTEDFLKEAIEYYKSHYGLSIKYKGYLIQFEPYLEIYNININQ